jgi:hypothetical protein
VRGCAKLNRQLNHDVDTRWFRTDTSAVETVKILIISVIALVIPVFFLFVLVMGTYGRLASLRRRCQPKAPPRDATLPLERLHDDRAYLEAVARYDAERSAFPTSLIARLFGFGPIDDSARTASRAESRR